MDLELVILIAAAVVGMVGVVLHYAGYIPRPYRTRLEKTETTLLALPAAIGTEVEAALNRVAASQRAEIEKELVTDGQIKSQLLNAAKNFKLNEREVNTALSEAILGPALPILRQFAPTLAEMIEENPQLVDVVLQNPLFKKYIEPRIAQFLGKGGGSVSEKNPFLTE